MNTNKASAAKNDSGEMMPDAERLKMNVKAGFDQLDRGEFSPHTADEIAERVLARKLEAPS